MTEPLRYSLLTDGSSDACLTWVLDWLIEQVSKPLFVGEWADLGWLPDPPRSLVDRIRCCLEDYPCDLLFIHRDAEKADPRNRRMQIERAVAAVRPDPPAVCVVPVRMTEAWLLFDERAIRNAAGNPNDAVILDLPGLDVVESVPDPKAVLHEALRAASQLSKRRLRRFRAERRVHRVAELITDYAPLRALDAFAELERSLREMLATKGWLVGVS